MTDRNNCSTCVHRQQYRCTVRRSAVFGDSWCRKLNPKGDCHKYQKCVPGDCPELSDAQLDALRVDGLQKIRIPTLRSLQKLGLITYDLTGTMTYHKRTSEGDRVLRAYER